MSDYNNNHNKKTIFDFLKIDAIFCFIIILLFIINMVVLYSATSGNQSMVMKQAIAYVIGFVLMVVIARFTPNFLMKGAPFLYVIALLLLIYVFFNGKTVMGATRWIDFFGLVRFQPSELMKIALPATCAAIVSRVNLPPNLLTITMVLILIAIPSVLILKQPDLGTTILVACSGVFVLFVAGLAMKYIIFAGIAFIPTVFIAWNYLHDYQKQRVLTFLNPELDPRGSGWNIIQSKTTIGSGGFVGKGWFLGTQSQLDFLPEGHTDFIIAVLAEEFGFIGVIILLTLYLCLLIRIFIIAFFSDIVFGKILATVIALIFFNYIIVNMGMVSGLLPVVGVPLPFMSNGGTHIVVMFIMCGILMSINSHKQKRGTYVS